MNDTKLLFIDYAGTTAVPGIGTVGYAAESVGSSAE